MRQIRKLSDQIAERFRPQRIILFGSYARGTATEDSDVDLLVVMGGRSSVFKKGASIRSAVDPGFALDILVRTPEELKWRLDQGDFFLREVTNTGKVLYEATDGRMGSQGRRRHAHRRERTAGPQER